MVEAVHSGFLQSMREELESTGGPNSDEEDFEDRSQVSHTGHLDSSKNRQQQQQQQAEQPQLARQGFASVVAEEGEGDDEDDQQRQGGEMECEGEMGMDSYDSNGPIRYNEIFVFGSNRYGQIGLSETNAGKNFCIPRFCHFNIVFTSVSCGAHHSVLLTQDGYAYTVGSNIYGQLGIEQKSLSYSFTPSLVSRIQDHTIIKVVSGAYHNLALTSDKKLFSWGRNHDGQLGLGLQVSHISDPQLVPTCEKVINVFSGWNHSFFITKRHALYSFGNGLYGQLGQGKCESASEPTKVLLKETEQKILRIAVGETHSLFLSEKGHVFGCGENQRGQVGLGKNKKVVLQPQPLLNELYFANENVIDIACGRFSVAVTQTTQSIYAWGALCNDDTNVAYTPQRITCLAEMMENQNASHNNSMSSVVAAQQQQQPSMNEKAEIRKIVVGGESCIAMTRDGSLFSWGKNAFGECGVADFDPRTDGFYPISFLKGKKILTFNMGETHSVILGREIFSRNLSRNQSQESHSHSQQQQQQQNHCSEAAVDSHNENAEYISDQIPGLSSPFQQQQQQKQQHQSGPEYIEQSNSFICSGMLMNASISQSGGYSAAATATAVAAATGKSQQDNDLTLQQQQQHQQYQQQLQQQQQEILHEHSRSITQTFDNTMNNNQSIQEMSYIESRIIPQAIFHEHQQQQQQQQQQLQRQMLQQQQQQLLQQQQQMSQSSMISSHSMSKEAAASVSAGAMNPNLDFSMIPHGAISGENESSSSLLLGVAGGIPTSSSMSLMATMAAVMTPGAGGGGGSTGTAADKRKIQLPSFIRSVQRIRGSSNNSSNFEDEFENSEANLAGDSTAVTTATGAIGGTTSSATNNLQQQQQQGQVLQSLEDDYATFSNRNNPDELLMSFNSESALPTHESHQQQQMQAVELIQSNLRQQQLQQAWNFGHSSESESPGPSFMRQDFKSSAEQQTAAVTAAATEVTTNKQKYEKLNDKLNQMNSAFQGLISKLAWENTEANEFLQKTISSSASSSASSSSQQSSRSQKQQQQQQQQLPGVHRFLEKPTPIHLDSNDQTNIQQYFTLDSQAYQQQQQQTLPQQQQLQSQQQQLKHQNQQVQSSLGQQQQEQFQQEDHADDENDGAVDSVDYQDQASHHLVSGATTGMNSQRFIVPYFEKMTEKSQSLSQLQQHEQLQGKTQQQNIIRDEEEEEELTECVVMHQHLEQQQFDYLSKFMNLAGEPSSNQNQNSSNREQSKQQQQQQLSSSSSSSSPAGAYNQQKQQQQQLNSTLQSSTATAVSQSQSQQQQQQQQQQSSSSSSGQTSILSSQSSSQYGKQAMQQYPPESGSKQQKHQQQSQQQDDQNESKELTDQELVRQSSELFNILHHQNWQNLMRIQSFKAEIESSVATAGDSIGLDQINAQKVARLTALLHANEHAQRQQEKQIIPLQEKRRHVLGQSQQLNPNLSGGSKQQQQYAADGKENTERGLSAANGKGQQHLIGTGKKSENGSALSMHGSPQNGLTNNTKFDAQIANLSTILSQKERDVADLQLTLANKEIELQQMELKNSIKSIQTESLEAQLSKALAIIDHFAQFANNFAKLA